MSETDKTKQRFIEEGFTHLQLLRYSVKLKPLEELRPRFRHQTLQEIPAKIHQQVLRQTRPLDAPCRHGMKRH